MKIAILIVLIFQIVTGKPLDDHTAKVVKYDNVAGSPGNYKFGFETSNGIRHEQSGKLKTINTGATIVETSGVYSFVAPDSSFYEVHYVADENGYRPQVSQKVTKVPPMPIAVADEDRFGFAPISINKNVIQTLQGKDSELISIHKKKDKKKEDKKPWWWPFGG